MLEFAFPVCCTAASMRNLLKLDPKDNVLIALTGLQKGMPVQFAGHCLDLLSDVPAKHKFATEDLSPGSSVFMYGVLVGKATQPIRKGELLTTRNLRHEASGFRDKSDKYRWSPPDASRWQQRSFLGYQRPDGQVGTRNYWLVVPLVFCENRNLQVLKEAFEEELGYARPKIYRQQVAELARLYQQGRVQDARPALTLESAPVQRPRVFQNIDGIKFLAHEGGCGGTREDSHNLCALLAGYIHHPNVAGATVLSLGCQNAQVQILREQIASRDPNFSKPLLVFDQQQSGSEYKMMSQAIQATFLGMAEADKSVRTAAPLSRLCVGLKCGGSDGFSGISANPCHRPRF